MNILILFICLLLGFAIAAGSFYWGYQIGIIRKTSEDDKVYLQNALDHIRDLEQHIEQLEFDKSELQRDLSRGEKRDKPKPTQWNPKNLFESTERR